MVALAAVLSVVSLVVRFRRSRGEERVQLKWFTSAGLLLPPLFILGDLPGDVVPRAVSDLSTAVIVLLPIAAGVAILRYRRTRSTGCSTARWSTGCSPQSSGCAMWPDRWCSCWWPASEQIRRAG
jgi:hypothetical protein